MPGFQLEGPRCPFRWLIPGTDTGACGQISAGCPSHWARTGVQRGSSVEGPGKHYMKIFRAKAWCSFYKQKVLGRHQAVRGFLLLWRTHFKKCLHFIHRKAFHTHHTPTLITSLTHRKPGRRVVLPASVFMFEKETEDFLNYKGFLFSPVRKQ